MVSKRYHTLILAVAVFGITTPAMSSTQEIPYSKVLMQAMTDEMARSMKLQMEDLEKPYFLQYDASDEVAYHMSASYGAITADDYIRSRDFHSLVRVGNYELDNTNYAAGGGFFGGGGGGTGRSASLPIEDDYMAIRQVIWRATDADYKDAVETLTKKKAYMKDKNLVDRPNDFTRGEPVEHTEPGAKLVFDRDKWRDNLKRISGHVKKYDQIQDSTVELYAGAGNSYVVNSEGTRTFTGDTGSLLLVTLEMQAPDGMRLSGGRSYAESSAAKFPAVEKILADIDETVKELAKASTAPILEQYSGPVLFDGVASAQMFRALLAEGVAGQVDPVGMQRRGADSRGDLEKKLDKRILPRSFKVYDDPTAVDYKGEYLFGHYRFDDEGMPAKRVDIVDGGKLENMCMSRVPTKKLSGSNGHARRSPGEIAPSAAIASLFIVDEDAVDQAELKEALIEAAKDEDLKYAVRVESIKAASYGASRYDLFSLLMRAQRGGGDLGDPVIAYKVYVDDGREEPFRGCEFGHADASVLKDIIASGDSHAVYNYVGMGFGGATPASAIVSPPVILEELEISKIEQEYDKLPILKAPLAR